MKLFGRELKIFKTPTVGSRELGESGTTIFGGYITDEDYVVALTGTTALTTYDKMRKSDGVIKAALLACTLPVRAANWYVEPASDDERDKEVADFISDCLFEKMTITWDDFLRQALLMLAFGFSVFEKVFTEVEFQKKQMIGLRKFAPRLQKTILKWKTEEGEDGITQQLSTGGTVSIPIEKLLVFTHEKEGDNWVGISILRNAYRSWWFKNNIEKFNAIGFERQSVGIPYAKLPKGYSETDRLRAEKLLKNLRVNEWGYTIIPDGWEVGFMDMKAGSVKDPSETIRRYNREILISVLAQFLDLGSGATGSRALSADHSSTFHNNLTAVARQVKDIMNKYVVKQLVDLNYTVENYPTLKFSNIGLPAYAEIVKALTGLTQQGIVVPDEKLEAHIRQLMSLPEKSELEEEEEKPEETPKEKEIKPEEKKKASEFFSWRSLTFAERKVNFAEIQRKMNEAENKLRITLSKILSQSSNDLIRQLQIVMETPRSPEKRERLKKMAVKYKGEYRKELFNAIKELFEYGKMMAAHEMKKAPPANPATSLQDMSKLADGLTLMMADGIMKAGKLALLVGLQQKKSTTEIVSRITHAVRKESRNIAFNTAAINISGAVNQGRRATFTVYEKDIYALQRSEILDSVTCNYCMSIDARVFRKKDSFTKTDAIHSSCRGLWVEIMKEEVEKPRIAGMPQTLRERFDTVNVFKPPKNPIIKRDSPAAEFLRKEGRL